MVAMPSSRRDPPDPQINPGPSRVDSLRTSKEVHGLLDNHPFSRGSLPNGTRASCLAGIFFIAAELPGEGPRLPPLHFPAAISISQF